MKALVLGLPLAVFACAPELQTSAPKSAGSNADLNSVALTQEQQAKKLKELVELKEVNNSLCVRYQKQVRECALATPLIPDDGNKVLGCISGVDPNAVLGVSYKISVTPPPGNRIYLSTKGGSWRTNEVGEGVDQVLTWGPRSPDSCSPNLRTPPKSLLAQIRSPKLLELSDLEVVLVPEDSSQCLSTQNRVNAFGQFQIVQNGEILFSKGDLSFEGGRHLINLSRLDQKMDDPACAIPQDEVEALVNDAKANAPAVPSTIPSTLGDELNREESRNNALFLALTGQVKMGCWAFQKVSKLEVKIDGSSVERKALGTGSEMSPSGNSKGYTFTFGRGLIHSIGDEGGMFRPGGGFSTAEFADRMIQELQFLKIEKQGTAYENEAFSTSRSCGFLGFGTCTSRSFRRYEIDRKSLSSIEIKVNDQLIYQNNSVNFTFDQNNMSWPPGNKAAPIYENPKYRDLMRRTDCQDGG
jgi:hypothetical protein